MTAPAFDLEPIRRYALGRLRDELAPELTYHSVAHTRDEVVPAALRLARRCGVGAAEARLLEAAALFHDLGYVEQSLEHERASVEIARRVLPGFGLTAEEIERVAGIILATRLPQSPRDLLEEILADADLDGLGRDDFFPRSAELRAEIAALTGEELTEEAWILQQLDFMGRHRYFTAAAESLRGAGKRANAAALERRLAGLDERFQVIAYSGYHGEQEPRALIVDGQRLEVVEIRDRWYDPRARHFRVRASDGRDYLVRYDLEELGWSRVETQDPDGD